jgi:hypothetical protein
VLNATPEVVIMRFPVAFVALPILLAACSGSITDGDPATDEEITRGPKPVRPPPTTSCASSEQKLAGPDGATICASYDAQGALSYAYSQDLHGLYHNLTVEYPPPPFGNCISADLTFSEGPLSFRAMNYLVHSFLLCWDQDTLNPITELIQYSSDGVGTYSYRVDNFNYDASVARATSTYSDDTNHTYSTLGTATLNLKAPNMSAAFSPTDVPNRFPTQLDRAAFFGAALAGRHVFQSVQIDRVSEDACSTINYQPATARWHVATECELGAALADYAHAQFANRLNWVDVLPTAGSPSAGNTPCRQIVAPANDPTKVICADKP